MTPISRPIPARSRRWRASFARMAGDLVRLVEASTSWRCGFASDLAPAAERTPPSPEGESLPIRTLDAFDLTADHVRDCHAIITNPPWTRDRRTGLPLHGLIEHLSDLRPTYLLFDLDWLASTYFRDFASRLRAVLPVGGVR
ncbi:MAG: hypothetical protein VYD87_10975 [Pseudomonadota bacterium]|nr:hypothetical protein [Pseudomonadota bacterium]MEE3101988.1 hypothetical protein [Pseudomonadota bacterium]